MSEIVVRPYEPRDQEQTWHVRAMTYNSGQPIPIEQQVYKTVSPFVAEADGRVVGTFVIMDMTCTRGRQAAWKTGGIAGVAVLPEARQSGVGAAMMRWSLRHMREQGYVLGSLYAFRESYYRRFGYEVCGLRYKITCPNSRLPRHRAPLGVRRVDNNSSEMVRSCYEAFARARAGMNLREEFHWGRILGGTKTIYAAGEPIEAYVILEHDWKFWEEQPVMELAWSTQRGYESMLSFLGSLGINKTSVTWYEPGDSPFIARHLDEGVKVEIEKPIMYRLINAQAALESLTSDEAGEFRLGIRDPDIPENTGPWQVRYGPRGTCVEPSALADIELDVRSAVQAILGQPSFGDIRRNEGECAEAAVAGLLPPVPVYCTEFF